MRYLINNSTDPYFNLAFDEFCLQSLQTDEDIFYLWRNRPSVIIGLNQNAYSEVNLEYLNSHGISLARRVTGGGAVYHDLQNLNYSFVGRNPSPELFAQALQKIGVDAQLSGRNDIFLNGCKISGYARRLWRDRELVHGTLMYDVDIDTLTKVLDTEGSKLNFKGVSSVRSRVANLKDYLPSFRGLDDIQENLQNILADGDSPIELSEDQLAQIQSLAQEKFATWDWIYAQSKEFDFTRWRRFECGSIELSVSLNKGRISELRFNGDFIGDLPPEGLVEQMIGVKYEREELEKLLTPIKISDYFSGLNQNEFVDFLLA